jgi:hypothetical protein
VKGYVNRERVVSIDVAPRSGSGRWKITGWKSIIQDIGNAGTVFVDQEAVEDGNLLSSRGPGDIPALIEAALRKPGVPRHREEPFEPRQAALGG